MILMGVSGWSYDDWIGPVYPQGLAKRDWLPFIAEKVDTLEVNVTYYRVPGERTVRGWVERTPDGFQFAVKANKSLTHERKSPDFAAYADGVAPLVEGGKLACILAQFPYSFGADSANRDYLVELRDGLPDLPVVVEFRNRTWLEEATFELLEELHFGFCAVDEPQFKSLMPPVIRATGPVGYVRFHGRNYEKWWRHDEAWERYNYSYTPEELREWVPRLNELESSTDVTLVYANNHYRGQSLETINTLRSLLADDAPPV
jgi:uncharacterized protein YecE (DUF72 family)